MPYYVHRYLLHHTVMMLMMSLGPILFGSNSTTALLVARATVADLMALLLANVRSMRFTQDAQVIPDTCK